MSPSANTDNPIIQVTTDLTSDEIAAEETGQIIYQRILFHYRLHILVSNVSNSESTCENSGYINMSALPSCQPQQPSINGTHLTGEMFMCH